MITRGVVEQVIDNNHVKVRIPEFDGVAGLNDYTSTQDLSVAVICTPPGYTVTYKIGDIVFIDFERNDSTDMPVVLGLIQGANSSLTSCDVINTSLEVSVNCKLPVETSIGNVSPVALQQLAGARNNLQRQIDLIDEKINAIINKL